MYKFIALVLLVFTFGHAQDGTVDATFNPNDIGFGFGKGTTNRVVKTVTQSDGKILMAVAEAYPIYNGKTIKAIIRLNPDGTVDESFRLNTLNIVGGVEAIALAPDNKIYIGGYLSTIGGVNVKGFARLNANGTLDTSFNSGGVGFSLTPQGSQTVPVIHDIVVQPNGKIIVGGVFDHYNGVGRNDIVRINSDGSIDTSFDIGSGMHSLASQYVSRLLLQDDGKIIATGTFDSYNGVSRNKIVRINPDGSLDSSFVVDSNYAPISVYQMDAQSDGKIVFAGTIAKNSNGTRYNMFRMNTDGRVDTTFQMNEYSFLESNNLVYSLQVVENDKVLIGGDFIKYHNNTLNRLARLNSDGSLDFSFNNGSGVDRIPSSSPTAQVQTIELQSNGKILVGGSFYSVNNIERYGIIRLESNRIPDESFNRGTGANDIIFATDVQSDGKILAGGSFGVFNGQFNKRLVRLHENGSIDTSFNIGSGFDITSNYEAGKSNIQAIKVQPDGKILVGGFFNIFNGNSVNGLVRLNPDGSLDNTFNPASINFTSIAIIRCFAIQPDGKILIGGSFTISDNGVTKKHVTRLNPDGTLDTSFVSEGITMGYGTINDIAIQPDGKMIFVGQFSFYNNQSRTSLVRVTPDGVRDPSFTQLYYPNNKTLYTVNVLQNGNILVGGDFTNADNNADADKLMILNGTDGEINTTFPGATDLSVRTVNIQQDGKFMVGGNDSNNVEHNLKRFNPNGTTDTSLNNLTFNNISSYGSTIFSSNLLTNGKMIVAGSFYRCDSLGRNGIARIINDEALSVNEHTLANNIVVYPNPVNDIMNLKIHSSITVNQVRVFDMFGKVVIALTDNFENIKLNRLSNGVYIVKVSAKEGEFDKLIIKK